MLGKQIVESFDNSIIPEDNYTWLKLVEINDHVAQPITDIDFSALSEAILTFTSLCGLFVAILKRLVY